MLGDKVMALCSRDCFLSLRSTPDDSLSSLLIVTDTGALSITTVSRRQRRTRHRSSALISLASHSPEQHQQQLESRKNFRANAGPAKIVSQGQQLQAVAAAPPKAADRNVDYLLLDAYGWNVRDLNPKKQKDLQDVSLIQAAAFHSPPVLFNDFFYEMFKAEVLSALTYKVRLSPPQRYTCLVAEESQGDAAAGDKSTTMVGVVDLTALDDKDMIQHLQDDAADEYLYVSGLAVDEKYSHSSVERRGSPGITVGIQASGSPCVRRRRTGEESIFQVRVQGRGLGSRVGVHVDWETAKSCNDQEASKSTLNQ